jgi:hypothetical protein
LLSGRGANERRSLPGGLIEGKLRENLLPIVARLIVDGMMVKLWVICPKPLTDTIESFFMKSCPAAAGASEMKRRLETGRVGLRCGDGSDSGPRRLVSHHAPGVARLGRRWLTFSMASLPVAAADCTRIWFANDLDVFESSWMSSLLLLLVSLLLLP